MFKLISAAALALLLSACGTNGGLTVNPYQGVDYGTYFQGDQIPDQTYIENQKAVVVPHCEDYARETNPSPTDSGLAGAVNYGVGGVLSGGAATAGNLAIVGAATSGATIAGGAVYTGVVNGTNGFINGEQASYQQVHAYTKHCLMANTGGYRVITQAELEELRQTGRSQRLEAVIAVSPTPGGDVGRPPAMP